MIRIVYGGERLSILLLTCNLRDNSHLCAIETRCQKRGAPSVVFVRKEIFIQC